VKQWTMKGAVLGPCNCDWGCPCNFDVPPSYGNCDGVYVYWVGEGRYGHVSLSGLKYAMVGSSPGAVHEGNMRSILVVDEAASEDQRSALEDLWKSGEAGLPFDIWNTVTSEWLETIVAPIEIELSGIDSRVSIDGGRILELAMSRVKNPVTGDEEELHLLKPTGFTSTKTELGMSTVFKLDCAGWNWDYTGRYGEFAEYEYAGPG
jgi:hypothetical protein